MVSSVPHAHRRRPNRLRDVDARGSGNAFPPPVDARHRLEAPNEIFAPTPQLLPRHFAWENVADGWQRSIFSRYFCNGLVAGGAIMFMSPVSIVPIVVIFEALQRYFIQGLR